MGKKKSKKKHKKRIKSPLSSSSEDKPNATKNFEMTSGNQGSLSSVSLSPPLTKKRKKKHNPEYQRETCEPSAKKCQKHEERSGQLEHEDSPRHSTSKESPLGSIVHLEQATSSSIINKIKLQRIALQHYKTKEKKHRKCERTSGKKQSNDLCNSCEKCDELLRTGNLSSLHRGEIKIEAIGTSVATKCRDEPSEKKKLRPPHELSGAEGDSRSKQKDLRGGSEKLKVSDEVPGKGIRKRSWDMFATENVLKTAGQKQGSDKPDRIYKTPNRKQAGQKGSVGDLPQRTLKNELDIVKDVKSVDKKTSLEQFIVSQCSRGGLGFSEHHSQVLSKELKCYKIPRRPQDNLHSSGTFKGNVLIESHKAGTAPEKEAGLDRSQIHADTSQNSSNKIGSAFKNQATKEHGTLDCIKLKDEDESKIIPSNNLTVQEFGSNESMLQLNKNTNSSRDHEVKIMFDSVTSTEKSTVQHTSYQCVTQDSEVPSTSTALSLILDTDQEMHIIEEIHSARYEKLLDLDVVQSCAKAVSHSYLLIVLDTNILLGHLEFINTLKKNGIPGIGIPVLIIPWVVLQELDTMKNGKLSKKIISKAIPAVQFIYTCLKNQDSYLWGQSMQLASQKIYGLSDENNDDRVLQCCLQYQNLYPQATIILCTDDKNLCSKALVSGVKGISKVDLIPSLQNLKPILKVPACQLPPVLEQSKTETEKNVININTGETAAGQSLDIPSILSDLELALGKALSAILETEMKIAFDELWMEMLYMKPPWSLADILQCFKKHWYAVFGQIVQRSLLKSIEVLYDNLYKGKTSDYLMVNYLLQESNKLLHAFSPRSDYAGVLPKAFAEVNKLLQTVSEVNCTTPQSSESMRELVSEDTSSENMQNMPVPTLTSQDGKLMSELQYSQKSIRSQEIWAFFESLWIAVSRYSTVIFGTFNYPQTSAATCTETKLMSPEEAFVCLQKLRTEVKGLLEGLQKFLAPNSSFDDVWPLYNFLNNNEIKVLNKFSSQQLYECLMQQEYREKLTIGCGQLAELAYNMEQCYTAVCVEAKNRGWI
nr:PREDICTED: transcriptional protein SWT1 isoform X2 [Latimeria chalumnae]|eukprot:XP_014344642.1 PREDICTED: transcriptional protein SWT1 isoform X2 [Latimeria chalumnae]